MAYWFTGIDDPRILFAKADRQRRQMGAISQLAQSGGNLLRGVTADDQTLTQPTSEQPPQGKNQNSPTTSPGAGSNVGAAYGNIFSIFGRQRRAQEAAAYQNAYMQGLGIQDQVAKVQAQGQDPTTATAPSADAGSSAAPPSPETVQNPTSALPPVGTSAPSWGERFRRISPGLADMFGVAEDANIPTVQRSGYMQGRMQGMQLDQEAVKEAAALAEKGYPHAYQALRRMVRGQGGGDFGEYQPRTLGEAGVDIIRKTTQDPNAQFQKLKELSSALHPAPPEQTTTTVTHDNSYLVDEAGNIMSPPFDAKNTDVDALKMYYKKQGADTKGWGVKTDKEIVASRRSGAGGGAPSPAPRPKPAGKPSTPPAGNFPSPY